MGECGSPGLRGLRVHLKLELTKRPVTGVYHFGKPFPAGFEGVPGGFEGLLCGLERVDVRFRPVHLRDELFQGRLEPVQRRGEWLYVWGGRSRLGDARTARSH